MYKCRYLIISTIFWLILLIIFLSVLIFGYVCLNCEGQFKVDAFGLIILNILVLPEITLCFIMINNFTFVKITLTNKGVEKKKLIGKKEFIEWNNIDKIETFNVPEYISASYPGYKISYNINSKDKKIYIVKKKGKEEIIESFFPDTLFNKDVDIVNEI